MVSRDAQEEGTKPLGFLCYKPAQPSISQNWKPWGMQNSRPPALKETLDTTSSSF